MSLPYKVVILRAVAFVVMRTLDKIYEGEDIWGENEPWWDVDD